MYVRVSAKRDTANYYQARVRKGEVKMLLESYLPGYLFTVNPDLLKNPKGKPHPTLLDQEVSKAIQSAEINLYLSHITDVGKKIQFLQDYQAIKEKYEGKQSRIAEDMKKYARTKPMLKEVIVDGKLVKQQVTYTEEKTYKDKDGKERIKHKAGDTKWDAKKLSPLGDDLLKEKDAQIESLKARLNKVKADCEGGNP